uniref:Branched-chain-amino-acid aminotransferase n=1 Tax=Calcidiscus leptoporus TaxID=127549 RepID=A0A7S0NV28_9EUKA
MADAVYEVTSVVQGKLLDYHAHSARLARSLAELGMRPPVSDEQLLDIHFRLISHNELEEGLVYLQVTRGEADRDFAFTDDLEPTLVLFTQTKALVQAPAAAVGLRVMSVDDIRWLRRDVKTVQLLAPSLAKSRAKRAGVDDAWMVDENRAVTEGTSNNAYIITHSGCIVTRHLSSSLLNGITRASVLRLAAEENMQIEERPFTIAEAQAAAEAFCSSATNFVTPVVEIDGVCIRDGRPGPMTTRLRDIYIQDALATAITPCN